MVEIWRFGVMGLLGCVGAIAELTVDIAVSIHPTFAQLTPDNTLGIDKSVVIPIDKDNDRIGGGAARGINLFHSFQDFNVGVGRGVYFANPQGITNIFSRVTGGNSSNILGKLGVLGDANLFLLNPNGILFGKNASLDLQGSFLGTTANGVQFGNQGVFSATNPEAPPLLTINPSALLFNQINQNAAIQNNSIAPAGKDPGGVDVFGLRVPDGKSLLLVGGNVSMDGGWAIANGGRIELGGLAEAGSIGIQSNGDNFSLSFPDGVQRGDISLNNKAVVDVIAGGGGSIAANARNLDILAGSQFFAGIREGLGTANTQAGDITVDATGEIKLAGANSLIFNSVQSQAVGNAGNITIKTGEIAVENSGTITSVTYGKGDAGDITINTRNLIVRDSQLGSIVHGEGNAGTFKIIASDSVELSGEIPGNEKGFPGGILAQLDVTGKGKGGNVYIETPRLSVSDGSKVQAATFGEGNAGSLLIRADEIDIFNTERPRYYGTGIFSGVQLDPRTIKPPQGNGGDLRIETKNLTLRNNGEIGSSTSGKGNSGNIFITARDAISLDGGSHIYNSVQSPDAVGNAGKIDITTGSLSVTNGAQINSFTRGPGNAGNITIQARDAVTFDGNYSASFSSVLSGAIGNGGNINITAGSLKIENEAGIFAGTSGKGNGGNITVEAKDLVEILSHSSLNSSVQKGAMGNAGDITIKTGRLIVRDSQIGPSVFGEGNAGDFNIIASESVELSGQIRQRQGNTSKEGSVGFPGGLFAQIDLLGKGRAGNLTIETRRLSVSDGSKIQAATFGDGDAGNIFIRADEIDLFETEKPNFFNTGIFAGVQRDGRVDAGIIDPRNGRPPKGQGGNLTIATKKLSLRDGAEVFVETQGEGDAGKLFIRATESVNVMGVSTGLLERQRQSRITAGASKKSTGNGGSLTIETPLLNVADGGSISSNSNGKGTAGDINITANIARLNNGQITAQTASTNGGNINFNLSQYLLLRNGSQISTTAGTAQAGGNGGKININSKFIVAIPEENSDISANAYTGSGGKVEINSQGIFGIESRPKLTEKSDITASSELGISGITNINSPDTTSIQNSFTELSPNVINTNALIANSCILRSSKQEGTFFVTGSGALRSSPGDGLISIYSTGEVRGVNDSTSRTWKKGEPIIEPQGVYRLADGRLVLSRECH